MERVRQSFLTESDRLAYVVKAADRLGLFRQLSGDGTTWRAMREGAGADVWQRVDDVFQPRQRLSETFTVTDPGEAIFEWMPPVNSVFRIEVSALAIPIDDPAARYDYRVVMHGQRYGSGLISQDTFVIFETDDEAPDISLELGVTLSGATLALHAGDGVDAEPVRVLAEIDIDYELQDLTQP